MYVKRNIESVIEDALRTILDEVGGRQFVAKCTAYRRDNRNVLRYEIHVIQEKNISRVVDWVYDLLPLWKIGIAVDEDDEAGTMIFHVSYPVGGTPKHLSDEKTLVEGYAACYGNVIINDWDAELKAMAEESYDTTEKVIWRYEYNSNVF